MVAITQNQQYYMAKAPEIGSISAVFSLHSKKQVQGCIANFKYKLNMDLCRQANGKSLLNDFLHLADTAVAKVLNNKNTAKAIGLYISKTEQKFIALPYTVKPSVFYNRPLCIDTLLGEYNVGYKNYIVIKFSDGHANIYIGNGRAITLISSLFNPDPAALGKDIDKLIGAHLANNILPIFVFGLHENVSHFIEASAWSFNVAEFFITCKTLSDAMITGLVAIWGKKQGAYTANHEAAVIDCNNVYTEAI